MKMRDKNVGFLPVCDESKKAIGSITDRDLAIRVLANGGQTATPVRDVMTREVVSCRPDDDVSVAARLMEEQHKSRVMCLDQDGRLAGVLSLSDIAQFGDGAQTLKKVSERELRA
jgi:CBS domain-containing protein